MANLQALSSSVLNKAKKLYRRKFYFHILTFLFAITSIFIEGTYLYLVAVGALISELLVWIINLYANSEKILGQDLIRLNILKNAYGNSFNLDMAYLKKQISKKEYLKAEEFEIENYYSTTEEQGNKKLLEILQESCFWSQHLYLKCKESSIKYSIIIASLIVLIILFTLPNISIDANYSIPRVILLFMVFSPLWDEISKVISYSASATKLQIIDHQIEKAELDTPILMSLFSDYNVVTTNTGLIPEKIYENEKERLTELWDERSFT